MKLWKPSTARINQKIPFTSPHQSVVGRFSAVSGAGAAS